MNFNNIPPVTRTIILLNVGVFLVAYLAIPTLNYWLAAYYPMSQSFKIWQIITHMFAHGGWMHLLFNMLTLFSFGPILEQVLGGKKFFTFYLLCGLGAFLLFNLWNFFQIQEMAQTVQNQGMNPSEVFANADFFHHDKGYYASLSPDAKALYDMLTTPMLGASGAIFGVVVAFAVLFPNTKLFFMFIPFPIKAKYLLPIFVVVSLYLGIEQIKGDNVAHFAHLGGAVVGFFWIRHWKKNRYKL